VTRPRPTPFFLFLLVPVLAAAFAAAGLRVNTSASLPLGLYLLSDRPPIPGRLVLACPPPWAARLARARGYLPRGTCPGGAQPLGKLLLAGPGATIDLAPQGLAVDGHPIRSSRVAIADSLGRPLPHAPFGRRRLAADEVWLFAPHPRSFDSRVFGPVPLTALRGDLSPLWTECSLAASGSLPGARTRPQT
jgi:conjugative transfer signal peptidase TraF